MKNIIDEFKQYLNKLSKESLPLQTRNVIEDIIGDIEYMSKPRKTTGKPSIAFSFFLDAIGRLVASVKEPSEEEKSLFWHASNPEYLLGLYKNDAWKYPLKALIEVNDFNNKGREKIVPIRLKHVHYNIIDIVDKLIKDKIYPNIH